MFQNRLIIALVLVALLVFSSGCNEELTEEDLQKIPEAKEFLEKYPDAIIKISYFSVDKFKTMKAYAPSSCKAIPEDSYFKLMLISSNATLYIYAEAENLEVACTHWEGGDECSSSEECDDKDPTTSNVCSGKPKKCSFELKNCREQKGDKCNQAEKCTKQFIKSSDSETCCPVKCTGEEPIDPCADVSCNENEKCDNGECRIKTCDEFGGVKCSGDELCQQAFFYASDSDKCCPVACSDKDLCADVDCASHLKCVGGKCILKDCDERNGYICGTGAACTEGFVSSANSSKCCPSTCKSLCGSSFCTSNQKCVSNACRTFTCAEMGGIACPGTTECNESVKNSYDQSDCCTGNCVHPEIPGSVFDIKILDVVIADETSCDNLVSIKATFKNIGEKIDLSGSEEYVDFELYFDGSLVANDVSRQIIEVNEVVEMNLSVLSVANIKSFTIAALADSDNDVQESNENNNSSTYSFDVGHDLSIVNISFTETETEEEYSLCATTIVSGGAYREDLVGIKYYLNGTEHFDEIFENACVEGNNSLERCLTVTEEEMVNGENEFKVVIDSTNLVKESNESNNHATTTLEVELPECDEATAETDCDDDLDYTDASCVEEKCVYSFVEGTDCGDSSSGSATQQESTTCFGAGILECVSSTTQLDTEYYESAFSVEGSDGDQCTTRWDIGEQLVDNYILEEGLYSSCTHSISEFDESFSVWGEPEGGAYFTVVLLHALGNQEVCSGTLIDRINEPCEQLCGYNGYGFGTCMTDEAKSIYSECSYSSEENLGPVPACNPDGTWSTSCCCAATEEDMLIPGMDGDLSTIGAIEIGRNYFDEIAPANCSSSQDIYFTVHNSSTQELEDVRFELYVDNVQVELSSYASTLERVTDDWANSRVIPEGEHLVSIEFSESTPGKTIKVVLDPNDYLKETDETNNVIETTFSSEKMDLSFSHHLDVFGDLDITITRDKILDYCPPFDIELYVDGVQDNVWFYGFDSGVLEETLWGPNLALGEHEIRFVIDPANKVDESDETNNDVTFTVTVEGPA